MTGDNVPEPGEDLLRKALARAVAGLTATGRLVVVEVAADGMTTFEIHRDEHGTALGRRWPLQWITLTAEHGWGEEARQALLRAAGLPAPGSEVVVVSSSPESATALQALEWLREARTAQVFATTAPITGLVRDVLVGDPLCRSYDLVVMRPAGAADGWSWRASCCSRSAPAPEPARSSPSAASRAASTARPSPSSPGRAGSRGCSPCTAPGSPPGRTSSPPSWCGRAGCASRGCPASPPIGGPGRNSSPTCRTGCRPGPARPT